MKYYHDFHIHTVHSGDADRNATVETYVAAAKEMGLSQLGFAEHFWDDRIEGAFPFYVPQTFAKVSQTREEIKRSQNQGMELYFGCEVEYDPAHKAPALTPEIAEQFDFVIVPNSHTHETMPKAYYNNKEKHKDFIVDAFKNIISSPVCKYVTGIAHPFSLVGCPYPCDDLISLVSDDTFKALFAQSAEKGIALEINISTYLSNLQCLGLELENAGDCQLGRMFGLAKGEGCKFFFGSDAHAVSDLNNLQHTVVLADCLDLKDSDLAPIVKK